MNGEHFARLQAETMKTLPGPWVGVSVLFDKGILVINPTPVPILKAGLPFVKLPKGMRIFGRRKGASPKDVFSMEHTVKREWWISFHTVDPHHVLTDWDGQSCLDPTGNIVTPTLEQIAKIKKLRES